LASAQNERVAAGITTAAGVGWRVSIVPKADFAGMAACGAGKIKSSRIALGQREAL
jgi:hypothetical protein